VKLDIIFPAWSVPLRSLWRDADLLILIFQMGAVSFIETMDHTSLSNIDQAEFEK
jgi:hypothetical protein